MDSFEDMKLQAEQFGNQRILYDAAVLDTVDPAIFSPDSLDKNGRLTGTAPGRGNALFFEFNGLNLVLRHYRRGGLIARLLEDRYVYSGLAATRAWREFRLLARLQAIGLPAPQPVAARVSIGWPFYRADIITRQIASARTLAEMLTLEPLRGDGWAAIGGTLRQFHDAGVFHADLNAHNIVLDRAGRVFLIDFDRGRFIRHRRAQWKRDNLQRLLRSLNKLAEARPAFNFSHDDWQRLQRAYHA